MRAGQATDVGLVRANNQDQALVADPLFAVADGMGGHAAGEVASAVACEALAEAWTPSARTPEALVDAIQQANRAVFDRAQANPEMHGMGTTLVAVALASTPGSGETVAIAHVGDSRVYRLQEGALAQLTVDHSLVAELVAQGQIQADEAERHPQRHVLSRALGVYPDVEVDLTTESARPGDRFLLCSDGLSREVTDDQIAAVLRRLADPTEAAKELVEEAKAHGGADNITVVVVDVEAGETPVADGASPADGATSVTPAVVGPATDGDVGPTPAAENDTSAPDATGVLPAVTAPAPSGPTPAPRKQRVVTVRVVAFILALLAVVALAIAGIAWYARSAWFVGLQGNQLVIYQGRPGGVLWFKPTLKQHTGVTTSQIEARHLSELKAGMVEPTLAASKQYVANLTSEERAAQGQTPPPSSTTVPPPTTAPPAPTTTVGGAG